MVMESFVALCAGIVLVYSGWRSRNRTLLLWGSNGFLAAAGIAGFLLAARTNTPLLFPVANFLLAIGGGCVWAAARIFAGKKAPIPIVVAGAFAGLAMDAIPAIRELTGIAAGVPLMIGAAYLLSAGATLLADQSERLVARWPVVGLLALHGGLLGAAGVGFVTGISEVDLLAPIGSLFGLIHFESIVFALGTAVFFLEMNKERSELANKVAAHTDGLTGIANRQGFMAAAERLLKRCRTGGQEFSVVMFDLDRFKGINDGHGHGTGDQVIQHFVRVVRDAMRPTDLFGRIGGEEFAMVLPGADIDAAFARADRIRMEFGRATFAVVDGIITATVSAGVAADRGEGLTALLADADAALYRAKAEGRNRVAKAASSGKDRSVLRVA
jgi:diguanylate cyclase (GGDEF)-like protein